MKFGQFMQYYKIIFVSKNSMKNVAWKLSWGTKLSKHNQNGFVLESYKAIYEEPETRTCFFYIKV